MASEIGIERWSWSCATCRFEISLSATAVTVNAGPPDDDGLWPEGSPPNLKPMVVVGADRRPVRWRASAWEEPDQHHRRLILDALDTTLRAELTFAYDSPTGLLSLTTVLKHAGRDGVIDLRGAESFSFLIREPVDRLLYLTGGWNAEAEIRHAHPGDGVLTMESRLGKTGFAFQPYLSVQGSSATYICEIFWSGNWRLVAEPGDDAMLLSGGLNEWRFRHGLAPGEELRLPAVIFGRTGGPLELATQHLHDFRRARRPDPHRPMPVQFNSWYPYLGEPTAQTLLPLVPIVRRLGCETFVIDAGWYQTDEGDSDADWARRTGDWRTSRRRFPRGLKEVADACHETGLLFGLWFEPEAIGNSSSIRRQHPEWLHSLGDEPPAPGARGVLNLGVPDAWNHVFERLSDTLRAIGVDWMKWDFNVDLDAGGWAAGLPADLTRRDPLVAHYEGLYRMQDALRTSFPDLILEMCAGGGGRMDGAILSHAHVNWMSDQPGAIRKLAMHFGTQLAHPAVVCNDWLIDWPGSRDGQIEASPPIDRRGDLAFRLRVAMLGTFGISAPIDRWSPSDLAIAASHVELYATKIRPLIHSGDQYCLTPPPQPDGNGDWAALWYGAKNGLSGVLFAFRLSASDATRVFALPGLRSQDHYRITFGSGTSIGRSGKELAAGLEVSLAEQYRSELCLVEKA